MKTFHVSVESLLRFKLIGWEWQAFRLYMGESLYSEGELLKGVGKSYRVWESPYMVWECPYIVWESPNRVVTLSSEFQSC